MKYFVGLIFLVAVAVTVWFIKKSPKTAEAPGRLTVLEMSGGVEKRVGESWVRVKQGDVLPDGVYVRTGERSEVIIAFSGGSELRLDERTEAIVDTTGPLSVFQPLGRTWVRVGSLLSGGSFEVETPTMVATVRGTAFTTVVTDKDSMVDVDENAVEVAVKEGRGKDRKVLATLVIEEGYALGTKNEDIPAIKDGSKKLAKEKIPEEVLNSEWFRRNQERDKKLGERRLRTGID